MKCNYCGADIKKEYSFCINCGKHITKSYCMKCGNELTDNLVCSNCGYENLYQTESNVKKEKNSITPVIGALTLAICIIAVYCLVPRKRVLSCTYTSKESNNLVEATYNFTFKNDKVVYISGTYNCDISSLIGTISEEKIDEVLSKEKIESQLTDSMGLDANCNKESTGKFSCTFYGEPNSKTNVNTTYEQAKASLVESGFSCK